MRRIGLDPVRHFRPPPADRSLGARLGVLVAVGLLLFAILGFRLWFLQILSGESYEVLAMNNRVREVEIEAARGVIYDRDGEALVENRAGLSVAILPMDLKNEAVVVRRLADVLSIPEEDIWSKLDQRENDPYREIIIKEDVPEVPVVTYLKEHSLEFPGVTIRKSYLRIICVDSSAHTFLGMSVRSHPRSWRERSFGLSMPANVWERTVWRLRMTRFSGAKVALGRLRLML